MEEQIDKIVVELDKYEDKYPFLICLWKEYLLNKQKILEKSCLQCESILEILKTNHNVSIYSQCINSWLPNYCKLRCRFF